jgi:hypothetical protein
MPKWLLVRCPKHSMSMRLYPALFILSPLGFRPLQISSLVQYPFASNAEMRVQDLVDHVTK